ncbi:MAG: cupin domain-containing protein [Steroidobacterales bacterium]
MSINAYLVEESAVPVESGEDVGVTWRTLTSADRTPTAQVTSGVCEIAVGGALGLHRHSVLELYYFLEGSGLVRLGGTERSVRPGVTVSIPADLPHGIRNTGNAPLRLFYVFPVDSFSEVVYTTLE